MSQNRTIGRVLSVDNFRVFIKIDDDLKGTYKSGISDIYEVARINSYLIIPVGSDRIVALITRITMKEEMEIDKNTTSISLPNSARYISATMLGTITQKSGKDYFIQGVYSFPALDNPVWYVTKKDLDQIFDSKDNKDIKYESDFYLPIGTSPAFQDYHVKMCPDQFFVKHAAILGNTGSGKSCTLTSILRNLFKYDYDKKMNNAHIVIFDTNGEYKSAFFANDKYDNKINEELHQINAYYYGGEEKVQIPYWLMNWQDFKTLLKPSDGTQAPILNHAIGLAKNNEESLINSVLPLNAKKDIESIINSTTEELKKRTGTNKYSNWEWKEKNEIFHIGKNIEKYCPDLGKKIIELSEKDKFNNADNQQQIRGIIKELYDNQLKENLEKQITNLTNIDLPIFFNYYELCTKFLDIAILQNDTNNSKINEFLSTLRLRMNSFLNDKRIAIPLMLKDSNEFNKDILPQFLALIFGDYRKCFEGKDKDNFIKKYNEEFTKQYDSHSFKAKNTNQITIVDISQLPYDILETITGLLGRIILEFVANFSPEQRGKYPIVIVLEEAQNYIAENKDSVSKKVFERIAREGRKYGISLIVSSQRPSELSKTVLSQCNSFIIHRLQNPDDQKYVRGLISSANADLLEQLPIIPQQHAIITGDCVRTPVQVRIDDVDPQPNSNNPKYISNWIEDTVIPYKETCNRWICSNNETDKKQ